MWEKVKVQRSTGSNLRMRSNQTATPLFFAADEEEGLTLHPIARQAPHSTTAPKNKISLFITKKESIQARNVWRTAASNLFSVLALEGKLALPFDLPVQTHLHGYHKFLDEGKRNSTETQKAICQARQRKLKRKKKGPDHETKSRGSDSDWWMKTWLIKEVGKFAHSRVSSFGELWDVKFFGNTTHAPGPWREPSYVGHSSLTKPPY